MEMVTYGQFGMVVATANKIKIKVEEVCWQLSGTWGRT